MAFVKMTNLIDDVIEVPAGAVRQYASLGFMVVEEAQQPEAIAEASEPAEPEASEEETFIEEMKKKPISQWSKDEVKKFATAADIDITGTKNVNEAKGLIKEYLEAE